MMATTKDCSKTHTHGYNANNVQFKKRSLNKPFTIFKINTQLDVAHLYYSRYDRNGVVPFLLQALDNDVVIRLKNKFKKLSHNCDLEDGIFLFMQILIDKCAFKKENLKNIPKYVSRAKADGNIQLTQVKPKPCSPNTKEAMYQYIGRNFSQILAYMLPPDIILNKVQYQMQRVAVALRPDPSCKEGEEKKYLEEYIPVLVSDDEDGSDNETVNFDTIDDEFSSCPNSIKSDESDVSSSDESEEEKGSMFNPFGMFTSAKNELKESVRNFTKETVATAMSENKEEMVDVIKTVIMRFLQDIKESIVNKYNITIATCKAGLDKLAEALANAGVMIQNTWCAIPGPFKLLIMCILFSALSSISYNIGYYVSMFVATAIVGKWVPISEEDTIEKDLYREQGDMRHEYGKLFLMCVEHVKIFNEKVINNLKTVVYTCKTVADFTRRTYNFICKNLGFGDYVCENDEEKALKCCEEFRIFSSKYSMSTMGMPLEDFEKLVDFVDQLNAHVLSAKIDPKVRPFIRACQRDAKDMWNRLPAQVRKKMEAVWINFMGGPGIGKSQLIESLLHPYYFNIIKHIDSELVGDSSLYTPSKKETNFESFYGGQYFMFVDEFAQDLRPDKRTEELLNMITLVNTAADPINTPFDNKGKIFGRKRVIYTTSNSDVDTTFHTSNVQIVSKDAARSRGIHIHMSMKFEGDESPHEILKQTDINNLHENADKIWKFTFDNTGKNRQLQQFFIPKGKEDQKYVVLTFAELIEGMVAAYDCNYKKFCNSQASRYVEPVLDDHAKQLITRYSVVKNQDFTYDEDYCKKISNQYFLAGRHSKEQFFTLYPHRIALSDLVSYWLRHRVDQKLDDYHLIVHAYYYYVGATGVNNSMKEFTDMLTAEYSKGDGDEKPLDIFRIAKISTSSLRYWESDVNYWRLFTISGSIVSTIIGSVSGIILGIFGSMFQEQSYKKFVKPKQKTKIPQNMEALKEHLMKNVTHQAKVDIPPNQLKRIQRIQHNLRKVEFCTGVATYCIQVLGLTQNYYLTNSHVFSSKTKAGITHMNLYQDRNKQSQPITIPVNYLNIIYEDCDADDITIFQIAPHVYPHNNPSIIEYFMNDKLVLNYNRCLYLTMHGVEEDDLTVGCTNELNYGSGRHRNGFFYIPHRRGHDGDCSNVYMVPDKSNTFYILGIHMSGNDFNSICSKITSGRVRAIIPYTKRSEYLLPTIKLAKEVAFQCKSDLSIESAYDSIPMTPCFVSKKSKRLYTKNSYTSSLISKDIDLPNDVRPTHCEKSYWKNEQGQVIKTNPMAKTFKNFNRYPRSFPPDCYMQHFEQMREKMYSNWYRQAIKTSFHELTLHEAVFGAPEKGIVPLKLSTSGGSYTFYSQYADRRALIDFETQWIHPKLVEDCELQLSYAKKGVYYSWPVMGCLKIETIDKNKVIPKNFYQISLEEYLHTVQEDPTLEITNTLDLEYRLSSARFFGVGDLPTLINSRRYIFPIMQAMGRSYMAGNLATFNPHSVEVKLIRSAEGLCLRFSTDFTGLDVLIPPTVVICGVIADIEFMGVGEGELYNILFVLMLSQICAYIQIWDVIYYSMFYYFSGRLTTLYRHCQSNTGILGSLSLIFYPHEDPKHTHIPYTCGDDLLTYVPHMYRNINKLTYKSYCKLFGLRPTNADKTKIVEEFDNTTNPEMVSRTFVYSEELGQVVGQLKLSSIYGILHWVNGTLDPVEALQQNIDAALIELFYHGKKIFNNVREQIIRALRKNNLTVMPRSYDFFLGRFRARFNSSVEVFSIVPYNTLALDEIYLVEEQSLTLPWNFTKSCEVSGVQQANFDGGCVVVHRINRLKTTAEQNIEELKLATQQVAQNRTKVQNTAIDLVEGKSRMDTESDNCEKGQDFTVHPMDNQVAMKLIKREYMIDSTTISTATTFRIRPFYLALLKVYQHLKYFTYAKFDIKIRIQLVSPVTTFGYLALCWKPWVDISRVDTYGWKEFSPINSATLSLADNEALEFPIQWTGPFHNGVVSNLPGVENLFYAQGVLEYATEVPPQRLDTDPAEFLVQTFVSITNPVVQAPKYETTGPQVVRFQSEENVNVDSVRNAIYTTAATTALSTSSWMANYLIKETDRYVRDTVKETMGTWFSESTENGDNVDDEGYESNRNTYKEDPSERRSVKQQVFGQLSVPSSSASFQPLDEVFCRKTLNGRHIGSSELGNSIYGQIRRWAVVMASTLNGSLTGASAQFAVIRNLPWMPPVVSANPTPQNYGFLPFYSRYFRFWRGSIEYRILVYAPPLVTLKILVRVEWVVPTPRITDPELVVGDIVTSQFTTRGTTEHSFVVPFVYPTAWKSTNRCSPDETPQISIEILSCSPPVNVDIPFIVLRRAGDDFMFSSLRSATPEGTAPPSVTTNTIPKKQEVGKVRFQGMFNTDDVDSNCVKWGKSEAGFRDRAFKGTVKDLLMRHSSRSPLSVGALPGHGIDRSNPATFYYFGHDIFDQICSNYVFYSGSFCLKATYPTSTSRIFVQMQNGTEDNAAVLLNTLRTGNAAQVLVPSVWPVLEVSIPLLTEGICYPTNDVTPAQYVDSTLYGVIFTDETSSTPLPIEGLTYVKANDDFALHILLPPYRDADLLQTLEVLPTFPGL